MNFRSHNRVRSSTSSLSSRAIASVAFFLLFTTTLQAEETWEASLRKMSLESAVKELNRTNCVHVMLNALQADETVKALIFMPGATDEFYFFRRAQAALTNSSPSLLDAVNGLRAQTRIRATFRPPLLLLHTDEDIPEPVLKVESEAIAAKFKQCAFPNQVIYDDRDWDVLQPVLRKALKSDIWPTKQSFDSWHFYRHSFAGWNLTGWEALEATCLAGKSTCVIQKQGGLSLRRSVVFFTPDKRVVNVTPVDTFPR